MSASKEAKNVGLKSLEEAAKMVNKPSETLQNWHRDNHDLFEVVIMGCVAKKVKLEIAGNKTPSREELEYQFNEECNKR